MLREWGDHTKNLYDGSGEDAGIAIHVKDTSFDLNM